MSFHTKMLRRTVALVIAALAGPVWAVPIMDGTKDAEYGAALSVQDTNTQFGDATNGDPVNGGGGSEIDAVYARVANGRLYVMVTGNLQTNFDKLEIFFDSEAGGINTINSATYIDDPNPATSIENEWHNNNMLPGGVDAWCCGKLPPPDGGNTENDGALQRMHGLTFDAGFNADHYVSINHGFENALSPALGFYASSAHYADLTNGVAGPSGSLGMQLAQRGLPNVLRGSTADFNIDGQVDGDDFLIWQRGVGAVNPGRLQGNADGSSVTNPADVDGDDLNIFKAAYGFSNATSTFGANYFKPETQGIDNSNVLLGPTLPSLSQGQLIDKTYALGPGGATDNAGAGAITRELEFVLPPVAGTTNAADHRNMQNIIDLQMAIDNSNIAGVGGGAGPATGNPEAVLTGIEFSIPLDKLGATAGGGDIKLMAFINGNGHHYASNQFSGDGVSQGNLGGDGFGNFTGALSHPTNGFAVNMVDYINNQFVTVANSADSAPVPEPTGAALLAFAVCALGARRRR